MGGSMPLGGWVQGAHIHLFATDAVGEWALDLDRIGGGGLGFSAWSLRLEP
jgi:hypothetical protein